MENQSCSTGKSAGSCSTEKTGSCGTKSKCCPVTLFKGAIVGGAVMFIWFSLSWMVLPWHKSGVMSFSNEKVVAATLSKDTAGIYILPGMDMKTGKPASAVTKPFAFVSVFPDGVTPSDMKHNLYKDLLLCLFAGALLTKVLKKRREGCCPIAGSVVIGLLVGVFSYLPNVIWFHFPLHYSLVGIADDIIAITLAGAAISAGVLTCGTAEGSCPVCHCSPCCCGKSGSCGTQKPAGSCSDKKGGCH